jgi:DtxR family manganese transport transcriptional regulator
MNALKYAVASDQQAEIFERIREINQSEIGEDYVRKIADFIDDFGEARVVELADCFGVTHATVNKVISRLQREGLVTSRPYRSIFLTDAGRELAEESRRRHKIVYDFLKAVGVSEKNAKIDTEGLAHHVSEETISALQRLTREKCGDG